VSIEQAARIGCGVADGLARAHALGIVHRDIKPDNILIDSAGAPRILDFGIARLSDSSLTQAGMTLGSPKYMSPEQIEGKNLDGRSDIYALGLVLYLVVSGREAFQGPNAQGILAQQLQTMPPRPRSIRPDVPEAMERLLLRMIAKDPAARPQSAAEIAQMLAALSGSGAPVAAATR
jgi:serine/threonine-protein kinase